MASLLDSSRKLCEYLGLSTKGDSSSSGSKSHLPDTEKPEQISEHVYEIGKKPERCSAEIVFFHGLELEKSTEPHITTWLSKDKKKLWLNWLQEDFQNCRVLTVRYDASLVRTNDQGLFDIYLTCENLLQVLTGPSVCVGEAGCPILLVGHCLGGLVLKGILVAASNRAGIQQEGDSVAVKRFLSNVKGIFCYASPNLGSELYDYSTEYPKGSLFDFSFKFLNNETARRIPSFES